MKSFELLMLPLKGLYIVAKAVVPPVLWLAKAIFNVHVAIVGLVKTVKIAVFALKLMSPPLRLITLALAAVAVSAKIVNVTVRALKTSMSVLLAPLKLLIAPFKMVLNVAKSLASTLRRLPGNILKTAKALPRLASSALKTGVRSIAFGIRDIGLAAGRTAIAIGKKLISSLWTLTKVGAAAFVGLTGWGLKLYADAETAEAGFTTMLKSMSRAKWLLSELTEFSASTPFQLPGLRDSAKLLLNAGTAVGSITDDLRMLGDVAAGTGKPIEEIVKIYAKVKSTGKVTMETLNQLAERGVPIYSALESAIGTNRDGLMDMLSKGKIGFGELDAAIRSTATGTGVFAGGMLRQSGTINGLISTWKDNFGLAWQSMAGQLARAFDFKSLISQSISFWQTVRTHIDNATPSFVALADVAQAAFGAIHRIGMQLFNSLGGGMTISGEQLQKGFVSIAAAAEWSFNNIETVAQLGFAQVQLYGLKAFETIKHFLTEQLPVYAKWAGGTLVDVFYAAVDSIAQSFKNLFGNVSKWSTKLFAKIASGGLVNIDFDYKPLLNSLDVTLKKMPNISGRVMTELEKELQENVSGLTGVVRTGIDEAIKSKLSGLGALQDKEAGMEIDPDAKATPPDELGQTSTGSSGGRQDLTPEAISRGSVAAFEKIAGHRNSNGGLQKEANKRLAEVSKAAKDSNGLLRDIKGLLNDNPAGDGGFMAGWSAV